MKSKKIIAMIVAFAAFMAVATSGLAAVSTTTTYNTASGKVEVDVDITGATANSEVTYLVNSGSKGIVYIDQRTADGSGNVSFEYKIDKDDMDGILTEVKYGTNGQVAANAGGFVNSDATIELANVSVNASNATVELSSKADFSDVVTTVGDGDTTYVRVTPVSGYVIESVTIGGVAQDIAATSYTMVGNKAIVVTTEVEQKQPGATATPVTETITFAGTDENKEAVEADGAYVATTLIKVTGTPSEVWVEVDGVKYIAQPGATGAYVDGGVYAVRIISADGTKFTIGDAQFK